MMPILRYNPLKIRILSWLWLICSLLCTQVSFAQFVQNGSFEGETGIGIQPDGWIPCDEKSTPDTQPDAGFGITKQASDGQSYLCMVSRGEYGYNAFTTEDCQTKLLQPLEPGSCYMIEIDLAMSDELILDLDTLIIRYTNPVKLEIYGGFGVCQQGQLLLTTDSIAHTEWQTYRFKIQPLTQTTNLFMKVAYAHLPKYYGNILVDNLRITQLSAAETVVMDTTVRSTEAIILNASPDASTYQWRPFAGLSCTSCSNPEVYIHKNTSYEVTMTDSIGCIFKEIFMLNVNRFVPNVFTPNNDGVNDLFTIDGLSTPTLLSVYDRFGKLVYTNPDYTNDWDGKLPNGELLPADNYWYILQFTDEANPRKGELLIWY